jgi:membrane associated rhomboid family serine protease
MFPLRDENPILRIPLAVILIIGINVVSWALIQGFGGAEPLAQSLCEFGLIPGDLLGRVPLGTVIPVGGNMGCRLEGDTSAMTLVTHMFLHGGWFHIIGNLWFLWVFGDNVEDAMGPVRFVVFYLLCGLVAASVQIMTDPAAAVPMVGASGAIGGVMGGYARLYPKAQVRTLIFLGFYVTTVTVPAVGMLGYWFLYVTTVTVPAVGMLGYWFFLQLVGGLPALQGTGGGVAFWAHIGGFLAGLVLVGLMHRPDYLAEHRPNSGERW